MNIQKNIWFLSCGFGAKLWFRKWEGGQKYESYNTPGELLSKKCLIVAPLLISDKSARKSPVPHL